MRRGKTIPTVTKKGGNSMSRWDFLCNVGEEALGGFCKSKHSFCATHVQKISSVHVPGYTLLLGDTRMWCSRVSEMKRGDSEWHFVR